MKPLFKWLLGAAIGLLPIGLNAAVISGPQDFIRISNTLQPNATFYVSSGTVNTYLTVRGTMTLSGNRPVQNVAPSAGQVLKWDNTNQIWKPDTDVSGGGGGTTIWVKEGNVAVDNNVSSMNFTAADFDVTSSPSGQANVSLSTTSINYIQNRNTLQSGSTFYVSSGSVAGQLSVNSIKFADGTIQISSPTAGGGSGDIEGVTAGSGLTGGGTSGTVTLQLDPNATHYIHNQETLQSGATAYPAFLYVDSSSVIHGVFLVDEPGVAAGLGAARSGLSFDANSTSVDLVLRSYNSSASGGGITFQNSAGTPVGKINVPPQLSGSFQIQVATDATAGLKTRYIVNGINGIHNFRDQTGTVNMVQFDPVGNSSFTIPAYFASSMTLSGGFTVQHVTPTSGQVLKFDGTNWAPGTDNSGGGGGATIAIQDGGSTAVETSTIDFTGAEFIVTDNSGEALVKLDFSSVTSRTDVAATYLTLSSAPATYLNSVTAASTYQPLDATLTDLAAAPLGEDNSIAVGAIAAGSLPTDVIASSVAVSGFFSDATVRSNLGLAIGTNVQAYDADLDDLADGSLTGSKVGSGVPAANIATGNLGAAVMASSFPVSGVTAGTYGSAAVVGTFTVSAQGIITGATNIPISVSTTNMNATGTASATTFLRGDNSWSSPAGTGDAVLAATQTWSGQNIYTSSRSIVFSPAASLGTTIGATANETSGSAMFDMSNATGQFVTIFNNNSQTVGGATSMLNLISTNPAYGGYFMRIFANYASNSNGEIRIDTPAPNIEFVETDQVSPTGKFEIGVNSGVGYLATRNSADNSFERVAEFKSIASGANGIIVKSTGSVFFEDSASSTLGLKAPDTLGASWTHDLWSTTDNTGKVLTQATSSGKRALFFTKVIGKAGDDIHFSSNVILGGGSATFYANGPVLLSSITTSGSFRIMPLNCTGNANGGALTTDSNGVVSCSDDDSGSAAILAATQTWSGQNTFTSTTTFTSTMTLSGGYVVQRAIPSSGQVLKFDGTYWAPGTDNNSGGGGSSAIVSSFSYTFTPLQVVLGSGTFVISNSTTSRPMGLFDASSHEWVDWQSIKLFPYTGATLQADVAFTMASATSGGVTWGVQLECITSADSADYDTASFDVMNSTVGAQVPATAGHLKIVTIPLTNSDSCAAADSMRARLNRLPADSGDTATGDAEFRWMAIRE